MNSDFEFSWTRGFIDFIWTRRSVFGRIVYAPLWLLFADMVFFFVLAWLCGTAVVTFHHLTLKK